MAETATKNLDSSKMRSKNKSESQRVEENVQELEWGENEELRLLLRQR